MREADEGHRGESICSTLGVKQEAFWLPKKGAGAEDYEDAFAASEDADGDTLFRAAVADGATESIFARRWAELLAERFVAAGPRALAEQLPDAQRAWADAVDARGGALPWYATAKVSDGAFATLLGLELHPKERRQTSSPGARAPGERPPRDHARGTWQATGVGDANLFHLRSGALLRAWPREEADAFDTRPALVPSRPDADAPAPVRTEGTIQPGDAFILATDAAAAWLLRTGPAGALRWSGHEAFAAAARQARSEGLLKNDDTTVMTIQVT